MNKELIGSVFFGVALAALKTLQAYIIKPIFDEGLNLMMGWKPL